MQLYVHETAADDEDFCVSLLKVTSGGKFSATMVERYPEPDVYIEFQPTTEKYVAAALRVPVTVHLELVGTWTSGTVELKEILGFQ